MKGEFERIMLELRKAHKVQDKQESVIQNLVAERYILVMQPDSPEAEQVRNHTRKFHEQEERPTATEGQDDKPTLQVV